MRNHTYFNDAEHRLFGEKYIIRLGSAGKNLLTDPDGSPLEQIEINVGSQSNVWKGISIHTERPDITRGEFSTIYRQATYDFRGDTLKVSHKYAHPRYNVLTDEMVTNIINTIDELIPGTTTATPQPERRANQERATPMKLPAPGRRRTPPRRP